MNEETTAAVAKTDRAETNDLDSEAIAVSARNED